MEGGERDEVGLGGLGGVGEGDSEDCVPDLLDVDGAGEGCFLGVVALEVGARVAVRDAVRRGGRVVAVTSQLANLFQPEFPFPSTASSSRLVAAKGNTHLTCSLTSSVTPASSSHLPRNSSPRNGFSGFFSLPNCSLRLAYCCLSVERNHLRTRRARFPGSDSAAGAAKSGGCSHQ